MSDADVIRRAAAVLRSAAEGTSPDPWVADAYSHIFSAPAAAEYARAERALTAGRDVGSIPAEEWLALPEDEGEVARALPHTSGDSTSEQGMRNRDYIARMHPGVGRDLVDGLQQHAREHDSYDCAYESCGILAVARQILGETA